MSFDRAKSKQSQNNFALGYEAAEVQLHPQVNDDTWRLYLRGVKMRRLKHQWALLAQVPLAPVLMWLLTTHWLVVLLYLLEQIGLGYTPTLQPGVRLAPSALTDGKNISAGGQKFGVGLELRSFMWFWVKHQFCPWRWKEMNPRCFGLKILLCDFRSVNFLLFQKMVTFPTLKSADWKSVLRWAP